MTETKPAFSVVVNRGDLLAVLQLAGAVVEKRGTIPILCNVRLRTIGNRLEIVATDLDITAIQTIPASVSEEGMITVDAQKFTEAIRASADPDVRLTLDNESNQLAITCGAAKFRFPTLPGADYPVIREAAEGDTLHIPASVLKSAFAATKHAISGEETRFQLSGIAVGSSPTKGKLDVVSTDGHRLAIAEVSLDQPFNGERTLFPAKFVLAISKLAGETFDVAISRDTISVVSGNVTLTARRQDFNFPAYRQVIASDLKSSVSVDRTRLLSAIKRASLAANERTRAIRFDFSNGRLGVSAISPEAGSAGDELPIDYAGGSFFIGLSSTYIADALNAIPDEIVTLKVSDENTQVQILPSSSNEALNQIHIVMPMRLG
jgi:DNA polymerase-3 subunit beta